MDSARLHLCFGLACGHDAHELLNRLSRSGELFDEAVRWHSAKSSEALDFDDLGPQKGVLITLSVAADQNDSSAVEAAIQEAIAMVCPGIAAAECFMTAPGEIPLFTASPDDLTVSCEDGHEDDAVGALHQYGVCSAQDVLNVDELASWQTCVSQRIKSVEAELAARDVSVHNNSIFTYKEIAARGRHRFDLKLTEEDLEASGLAEWLARAPWRQLVTKVLGDDVCEIVSVVYSRPDADAQEWHSDGPHLSPSSSGTDSKTASFYALCVFVPLMDLSQETGYTQFWPGSHKHAHLLGFGPACIVLDSAYNAITRAGSAIIYDYRTLHRGMPNATADTRRDVLQVVYHVRNYEETYNYNGQSLQS